MVNLIDTSDFVLHLRIIVHPVIDLVDYHVFRADEMPALETIFIQTYEPSHPFGVKAVAEIPLDGVAPAVGNAILDACGANLTVNPATPERVWRAINHL